MAQDGLEPHVIELHMHRSKVEPNSKLEEMEFRLWLMNQLSFIIFIIHGFLKHWRWEERCSCCSAC